MSKKQQPKKTNVIVPVQKSSPPVKAPKIDFVNFDEKSILGVKGAKTIDGIHINPVQITGSKSFLRRDCQVFDFDVMMCHNEETFQNDSNPKAQFRIYWTIPEGRKLDTIKDGKVVIDPRGQLSEVKKIMIRFNNHLHDDMVVFGSTPHGRITKRNVIASRTHNVQRGLRSKASTTITIKSLGDDDNTFGPLIIMSKGNNYRMLGVYDFAVKLPQISEYTGQDYNKERIAFSVSVEVRYVAMDHSVLSANESIPSYNPEFALDILPSLSKIEEVSPRLLIDNVGLVKNTSEPRWMRVEESRGEYITVRPTSHRGGFCFALYHCNSKGDAGNTVVLPLLDRDPDSRAFVPGIAVTTAREDFFTDAIFRYSREMQLWVLEDPSEIDGILWRADLPRSTLPVVTKYVPVLTFLNRTDEVQAQITLLQLINGVTEVIRVLTIATKIASMFL